METIKIAHLYYDLMNLYGEHGNILAIRHHLEAHKVRVIIHYLSIEDDIDFSKYDIFYIGSGNKESFFLTLENVMKRKDEFLNAFKKKKFFFITGNALDLFGKCFHTLDGSKYETLGFFSYESYETDFRIVGEQVYEMNKLDKEIKKRMERELRQYYDNKKKIEKLKDKISTRRLLYLEERVHYVENVYNKLRPFEQEVYKLIFLKNFSSTYCETHKNISKTTYYNIFNKSIYYLAEEWGEI